MALVRTHRTTGKTENGTGISSWNSGSFTPSNNSLLVAFTSAVDENFGNFATSFTISGGSLTWTSRAVAGVGGTYRAQGRCWTAPVTTGASMSLALGNSAATVFNPCWTCIEFTGHDTTTPTGATSAAATTTAAGALTNTLSGAPATDSYVVAFVAVDGDVSGTFGVTPGSGWTEITESAGGSLNAYCEAQERTGSTSTSVAWVDIQSGSMPTYSSVDLAVEIKAAAAGAAYVPPTIIVPRQAVQRASNW